MRFGAEEAQVGRPRIDRGLVEIPGRILGKLPVGVVAVVDLNLDVRAVHSPPGLGQILPVDADLYGRRIFTGQAGGAKDRGPHELQVGVLAVDVDRRDVLPGPVVGEVDVVVVRRVVSRAGPPIANAHVVANL